MNRAIERAAVRTEGLGLDHLLGMDVPDGDLVAETVGSIPAAHCAGGPNVVLIARSPSGVIAKSYM